MRTVPIERDRAMYFDDFEPGQVMVSPGRTVTEHDVMAFAGLSGDYNPLHTDDEFARGTPFGARIAHGVLGLAIATGLANRLGFMEGTAVAFAGLEWKFRKPVMFGDTIHVEIEVGEKKAMPAAGGGLVSFAVRVRNQRSEIVQRGSWQIIVRAREEAEAG